MLKDEARDKQLALQLLKQYRLKLTSASLPTKAPGQCVDESEPSSGRPGGRPPRSSISTDAEHLSIDVPDRGVTGADGDVVTSCDEVHHLRVFGRTDQAVAPEVKIRNVARLQRVCHDVDGRVGGTQAQVPPRRVHSSGTLTPPLWPPVGLRETCSTTALSLSASERLSLYAQSQPSSKGPTAAVSDRSSWATGLDRVSGQPVSPGVHDDQPASLTEPANEVGASTSCQQRSTDVDAAEAEVACSAARGSPTRRNITSPGRVLDYRQQAVQGRRFYLARAPFDTLRPPVRSHAILLRAEHQRDIHDWASFMKHVFEDFLKTAYHYASVLYRRAPPELPPQGLEQPLPAEAGSQRSHEGDAQAQTLALHFLELSNRILTPKDVVNLGTVLSSCEALQSLNLRGCNLSGDRFARAGIIDAATRPALHVLNLSSCSLSRESVLKLAAALRRTRHSIEHSGSQACAHLTVSLEDNDLGGLDEASLLMPGVSFRL